MRNRERRVKVKLEDGTIVAGWIVRATITGWLIRVGRAIVWRDREGRS